MTRLTSLIEGLTKCGFENGILDQLILDYYNDQDSIEFEGDSQVFLVLDDADKYDFLYDKAEELVLQALEELDDKLGDFKMSNRYPIMAIINGVSQSEIIESVQDILKFDEEYGAKWLCDVGEYSIYVE